MVLQYFPTYGSVYWSEDLCLTQMHIWLATWKLKQVDGNHGLPVTVKQRVAVVTHM